MLKNAYLVFSIYLQKPVPIQPKTGKILPNLWQKIGNKSDREAHTPFSSGPWVLPWRRCRLSPRAPAPAPRAAAAAREPSAAPPPEPLREGGLEDNAVVKPGVRAAGRGGKAPAVVDGGEERRAHVKAARTALELLRLGAGSGVHSKRPKAWSAGLR